MNSHSLWNCSCGHGMSQNLEFSQNVLPPPPGYMLERGLTGNGYSLLPCLLLFMASILYEGVSNINTLFYIPTLIHAPSMSTYGSLKKLDVVRTARPLCSVSAGAHLHIASRLGIQWKKLSGKHRSIDLYQCTTARTRPWRASCPGKRAPSVEGRDLGLTNRSPAISC